MEQKLKKYLEKAGMELGETAVDERFLMALEGVAKTPTAIPQELEKLLTYRVPRFTEDGTCSAVPGDCEKQPYDLRVIFKYNHFEENTSTALVARLDAIVAYLNEEIKPDWIGIYKTMNTQSGPALIKLAYRGRASRAEFPLTEEFAQKSNNSTVGLTGKAKIVNSVREHIENGQPYYQCDIEVQSELCLPIFSDNGTLSAIIDIETFRENFFNDDKIVKAATACVFLGDILM